MRMALLVVAVAAPVLAGGWWWFRDSPLVAVEHVQLRGVSGPEAAAIDGALTTAARRMSTLDVRSGSLLAAVAPFRVVREVHAVARFPHGLSITVVEQLPVAALTVASERTAVAADGTVLGPALLTGSLPTLDASSEPLTGRRVTAGAVLASLAVLGAAPAPLARLIARAYSGPEGLTIAMRSGLLVYFGDSSRPHAKWLSLARVLADPSSAGASYVDVRLPERPAAGFPAGVTAPDESASGTEAAAGEQAPASEESTVAALAAGLNTTDGAAPASAGAPATGEPESSPSSTEQATAPAPQQTTTSGEQPTTPAPEQTATSAQPLAGGAAAAQGTPGEAGGQAASGG
jgi:cell division protein FtsQ